MSFRLLCIANIKALRGSLGALSVNKLSHIPKIQPISAIYKNNDVAFVSVYLSSYLPLKYPTHFQSLRSDYYAKRKQIMTYERDPQFLHMFLLKILLNV